MGRQYLVKLERQPFYCCNDCNTHLAIRDDLISEAFRGRTGTAWLFNKVVNVYFGQVEDRMMTTGLHTIADIYCKVCNVNLGWKYEQAFELSQKYKQGKYILERELVRLIDEETESDPETTTAADGGGGNHVFLSDPSRRSYNNPTRQSHTDMPSPTNNTAPSPDDSFSRPVPSRAEVMTIVIDSTPPLNAEAKLGDLDTDEACAYFTFFHNPKPSKESLPTNGRDRYRAATLLPNVLNNENGHYFHDELVRASHSESLYIEKYQRGESCGQRIDYRVPEDDYYDSFRDTVSYPISD